MIILSPTQQAYADQIIEAMSEPGQTRVLSGYAGTGKTTSTEHIAMVLIQKGLGVYGLAPTHKAVAVLRSRLPTAQCKTIHSFLGLKLQRASDGSKVLFLDGVRNSGRVYGHDVLIIDESSMIDDELYGHILDFQRANKCSILFLGDPAQLPPVDNEGKFSPVWDLSDAEFRLTEIMRQKSDSGILPLSKLIRDCLESGRDVPFHLVKKCAAPDVVIANGDLEMISQCVASDVKAGRDTVCLAYTNKVVDEVNRRVHKILGRKQIGPGDRVITGRPYMVDNDVILTTAQELNVVYEATGPDTILNVPVRWLMVDHDSQIVPIAVNPTQLKHMIEDTERQLKALTDANPDDPRCQALLDRLVAIEDGIADFRLGFAHTVHRSQGSTYDTVFVVWEDLMKCYNQAERLRLLYVAVTRPSKRLAIIV